MKHKKTFYISAYKNFLGHFTHQNLLIFYKIKKGVLPMSTVTHLKGTLSTVK